MDIRPADTSELDHLARLWHEGWHDAHASFAPAALVAARTPATFRERLAAMLTEMRVAGAGGAALGLCVIKDDELNQLFVARHARGTGVAGALIEDGEARLVARGVAVAWLACGIGNHRAARFYEKRGWTNARTVMHRIETAAGVFEVPVWRYEKALRPSS